MGTKLDVTLSTLTPQGFISRPQVGPGYPHDAPKVKCETQVGADAFCSNNVLLLDFCCRTCSKQLLPHSGKRYS